MKAGIVGIPLEELLKVAKSVSGINILTQKGFVKLTGNIPGRAVYPANTKVVSEVHFSGYSTDPKTKIPGLMANPKFPKPTKRVTHFLDQREGNSVETILSNFRKNISAMVTEQAEEPVTFEAPIVETKVEIKPPEQEVQEQPVAIAAEKHEVTDEELDNMTEEELNALLGEE